MGQDANAPCPIVAICKLLDVGHLAAIEGNFHVLVDVDLLGSQVHDALRLPQRGFHLVRRLAQRHGRRCAPGWSRTSRIAGGVSFRCIRHGVYTGRRPGL
jgi:hypothetical protein